MKIALTGEGPTDYGKKDYDTREWMEGPIQKYGRKIAQNYMNDVLGFQVLAKEDLRNIKVQRRSLQGLEGYAVPAKKFATWMGEQGLDKGIFYCDADRNNGTKNNEKEAKKRFAQVYGQIEKGLEGTGAIPAVALHMIESWILGDKNALENAFDVSIPDNKMPNKPELIWGDKRDPESDYPKNYLKRLISETDKRYEDLEGNQNDFVDMICS